MREERLLVLEIITNIAGDRIKELEQELDDAREEIERLEAEIKRLKDFEDSYLEMDLQNKLMRISNVRLRNQIKGLKEG